MTTKKLLALSGLISAAIIFSPLPQAHAFDFSMTGKSDKKSAPASSEIEKPEEQAPEENTPLDLSGMKVAKTSQLLSADDLPQVVVINEDIIKSDDSARQPRLQHLQIRNLKLDDNKKTVEFSIHNGFDRKNAKPIRIGGLLLTGQVRYDYDNGKELHNSVLFKEKRLVLKKGSNTFVTDPDDYPHVTSIEKLQFFFLPAKTGNSIHEDTSMFADTSQQFDVNNLPSNIVIDRATIEQNAEKGDPRLGFLRINNINCNQNEKVVNFSVENIFDRQDTEPIHVGNLLVTGMARYDFDNGKELHSCILFEDKHVILAKGATNFKSTPELYPGVAKIESIQFILTP